MFALGGPNIQQSALNFYLFVENCRFQMQLLVLKANIQVNTTKELIFILFTQTLMFAAASPHALIKMVSEMVWFLRDLLEAGCAVLSILE